MVLVKKILITSYERKNLKHKGGVKSHIRTIHRKRDSIQPKTLYVISNIFEEHPDMLFSITDINRTWNIHRATILKYLRHLEKQKKIVHVIRNNKVYWAKKKQNELITISQS